MDPHVPPPSLDKFYPDTPATGWGRWGVSMQPLMPVAPLRDETSRTHKVVDGDTLAGLAERFLESAARARDIFDVNRDVLSSPEPLPIGVELKIPSRVESAEAEQKAKSPAAPPAH